MNRAEYLSAVNEFFYQGEVLGEAFFGRCLELETDPARRYKWANLQQLETDLVARGVQIDEGLRREHQRQAVNQVSVGNCVTSLRLLSALDWNEFFETTSLVEAIVPSRQFLHKRGQEDPQGH